MHAILPDAKVFVYVLALFSDDGCNVTVNGNLIHQRMGQGSAPAQYRRLLSCADNCARPGRTH